MTLTFFEPVRTTSHGRLSYSGRIFCEDLGTPHGGVLELAGIGSEDLDSLRPVVVLSPTSTNP